MVSEGSLSGLLEGRSPDDVLEDTILVSRSGSKEAERVISELRDARVVIYGAGTLGRRLSTLLEGRGVRTVAFADSDPRLAGSLVSGVPVFELESAVAFAGTGSVAVVAVWNPQGHSFAATARLLRSAGCATVKPFPAVAAGLHGLLPHYCLDDPGHLWQSRERIKAAYGMLSDRRSQAVFAAHLAWRVGEAWPDDLPPEHPQYFPGDVFSPSASEVVVDCGAFDGDTLRMLVSLGIDFAEYHAFEPDPANLRLLRESLPNLPRGLASKVMVHAAATADYGGPVAFRPCGDGGALDGDGDVVVRALRLDDELKEVSPTLIKADVEGAEMATLRGARDLIEAHRPVLAFCAYHRPSDLWELPLLCRETYGDYRLSLRAHGYDGWETVLYAVPPGRVPNAAGVT